MKVKCTTKYQDSQLNRLVSVDEELEVTEDRANVLINSGVCVELIIAPDNVTEEKPKKATRKKKVEG